MVWSVKCVSKSVTFLHVIWFEINLRFYQRICVHFLESSWTERLMINQGNHSAPAFPISFTFLPKQIFSVFSFFLLMYFSIFLIHLSHYGFFFFFGFGPTKSHVGSNLYPRNWTTRYVLFLKFRCYLLLTIMVMKTGPFQIPWSHLFPSLCSPQ